MLIYLKTETRKGHQARGPSEEGAKGRGRQQGGELGLKGELNYSNISVNENLLGIVVMCACVR